MKYSYFDKNTGQFRGTFTGDFLPNGATTVAPPTEGGPWYWDGASWGTVPQGFPDPAPNPVAVRRKNILSELATLDRFLPRSVEDLLDAGVIQLENLSQENQARRAQKLALRDELAELEV